MLLVEIGKIYFMDYTNIKSNEANTPMNIKELHGYIKKNSELGGGGAHL